MTGVYEHALGEAFERLHPKVRDRYGIGPDDDACIGRGEMDITRGRLALPALLVMPVQDLLFPESGEDVPFSVTTVGYRHETGHEVLATRRAFDFGETQRRFDSLTLWDDEHDRLIDFLGRDGLIASELRPRVDDGALVVEGGRQWLRVGSRYLTLPGPFAATVEVRDRFDEAGDQFRVTATVENTLVGHILGYRGTFTQEMKSLDSDGPRLATGFSALPPP